MTPSIGLVLVVTLAATPERNPHLPRAVEQLHSFDVEGALVSLEQAKRWPYNTERDLAEVNLYLGWAYAEVGNTSEALERFRLARLLTPGITLPPDASPKLLQLWVESGGAPADPPADPPPWIPPAAGLSSEPPPTQGPRWTLPTVVAAGAVVALAAALVAGSRSMIDLAHSNAEPRVGFAQALHGRAQLQATAANVFFGMAGALGAASVVFHFTL
jgi:hypothetical protein